MIDMPLGVKFLLVLLPLLTVFIGIIGFKRRTHEMAIFGLIICFVIAVLFFETSLYVATAATIYGFFQSFGISIAIVFTMLLIFLMKEVGALDTISQAIKRVAHTREEQALFIGIGFGTFVTSLGVVTPALFPPLLMAMGFGPSSAVAISVLGYNASTSFALLSIPVTLPADLFAAELGMTALEFGYDFAFRIALFLPVIATIISCAMLWIIGGLKSLKKGILPAVLSGLVIGVSSIILVVIRAPIMILGVIAGILSMIVLYAYFFLDRKRKGIELEYEPMDKKKLLRALSPWLLLITLASIASVPSINVFLRSIDPGFTSWIIAYETIEFNVFAQVYFWIGVAAFASFYLLKPTKKQTRSVLRTWSQRIWGPFIAYSLFFSIAYIMAFSGHEMGGQSLQLIAQRYNMNYIVGIVLGDIFGPGYIFVAASLGIFGAIVGGSETASNVLFFGIQRQVTEQIGLTDKQFMTVYASHGVAGGVASAITPSKITNAVATIGKGGKLESEILRKHLLIVFILTLILSMMTALFVSMGF
ncbi:MAG: L-lactate permease [Candidatus Saliniplasma sp.]